MLRLKALLGLTQMPYREFEVHLEALTCRRPEGGEKNPPKRPFNKRRVKRF